MQTTNRYAADFCDCVGHGELSPHRSPADCAMNRAATANMLAHNATSAIDSAIAGMDLRRAEHHSHYRPQYGCPLCPLSDTFVRHGEKWVLPQEMGMILPQEDRS